MATHRVVLTYDPGINGSRGRAPGWYGHAFPIRQATMNQVARDYSKPHPIAFVHSGDAMETADAAKVATFAAMKAAGWSGTAEVEVKRLDVVEASQPVSKRSKASTKPSSGKQSNWKAERAKNKAGRHVSAAYHKPNKGPLQ